MASVVTISPAPAFRAELARRGGGAAARCMQCATCSSVCDLAGDEAQFPRRQLLWAQWGLVDRLAADPALWLCHQCNDCTVRCPRDARPGDAMQALRAVVIEHLAAPQPLARLVGRASATWPILLGVPILFWALFIRAAGGFGRISSPLVYADVVPQWMIYSVFLPAGAFALVAAAVGARRAWNAWGTIAPRNGPLLRGLASIAADVLLHRRFANCGVALPRQTGHLLLMWGFIGALATTTLLGIAIDLFGVKTPLPQLHPIKLLGNASAVLLAAGAAWLGLNRLSKPRAAGASRAFDVFFLALVALVVASGIGAEIGRYAFPGPLAVAVYVAHLGTVLSLFLTLPFSKFAHALYRSLAMAHERLTPGRSP